MVLHQINNPVGKAIDRLRRDFTWQREGRIRTLKLFHADAWSSGGLDFWSRPIDLIAFKQANQDADTLTISSGTHFVFLERLEKGKQQLIDTILRFLNS